MYLVESADGRSQLVPINNLRSITELEDTTEYPSSNEDSNVLGLETETNAFPVIDSYENYLLDCLLETIHFEHM